MPAKASLQRVEKRSGHPSKIPFSNIAILNIVLNSVRENMLRMYLLDAESVLLEQVAQFAFRVSVRHRAAGFRFRVARHHLREPPEAALSVRHQDPKYFPRVAIIDHDFYRAARAHIIPELLEDALRMRRVMDYAERINQVIRFDR